MKEETLMVIIIFTYIDCTPAHTQSKHVILQLFSIPAPEGTSLVHCKVGRLFVLMTRYNVVSNKENKI